MKTVQLEEEREKVLSLSQTVSERSKLRILLRFFDKAESAFPFQTLESYYLEFLSSFANLVKPSTLDYSDIHILCRIRRLIQVYEGVLEKNADPDVFRSARNHIQHALLGTYLLLGEQEDFLEFLKEASGETISPKKKNEIFHETGQDPDPQNRIHEYLNIIRENDHPQSHRLILEIRDRWMDSFFSLKPDVLYPAFVEKMNPTDSPDEDGGVLFPLKLNTILRPGHPENHSFLLDHETAGAGRLYNKFYAVVDSIRPVLERSSFKPALGRYYQFKFGLPQKDAVYSGNSLEAVLGILMAAGMSNAYYGSPIVRLNQGTVVTGGLDSGEDLIPVDELGLKAKIKAAFFSPVRRMVVPWANIQPAAEAMNSLRQKYPKRNLILESAENLDTLLSDRNIVISRKPSLKILTVSVIKHHQRALSWIFAGFVLSFVLFQILQESVFIDRNPAIARVEGNVLTVQNRKQQNLWTHEFGIGLTASRYNENICRRMMVTDIDRDNQNEIILGIYENTPSEFTGRVYVFEENGALKFNLKTGRRIKFGGIVYDDHYRIAFVDAQDLDGDGNKEIISISHQYPWFPCVVNAWNYKGESLGEYWHTGQLERLYYHDVDADSVREIFALGQNNELASAVMVVLEPFNMNGLSPHSRGKGYDNNEILRANECCYLKFPQSEIYFLKDSRDYGWEVVRNWEGYCVGVGNGCLSTSSGKVIIILYFQLDEALNLIRISIADSYTHFLYQNKGQEYDNNKTLRSEEIGYFDGKAWVNHSVPFQNKK